MSRGYRCIGFAAFGWLALTGQHPSPRADREQAKTQQSIADSLSNIAATNNELAERAKSPVKREPCGPQKYQSDDDLCAQWKAADAAADAAGWAAWGTWLSAFSLFAVAIAIRLTIDSNRIARDTAKRQLRAYVGVKACSIDQLDDGSGFIIQAEFVNSGQTPAYKMRMMAESFADEYPMRQERAFLPFDENNASPIMPGETFSCAYRLDCDDAGSALGNVINGRIGFYIQGICEYYDAFNERRETRFRYVFGGRIARTNGLVLHAAATGNIAT